ncbi:MAG: hypothetical protein L6Q76_27495, partial [Polyangiaceae bacterium]|nr:hypothetical protein [Polyangiaceae bacterium]
QTALTVEQALEMLGLRVVRPGQKKASAASSASAAAKDDRNDLAFEGTTSDSMELTPQPFSLAKRNADKAPVTARPPRR